MFTPIIVAWPVREQVWRELASGGLPVPPQHTHTGTPRGLLGHAQSYPGLLSYMLKDKRPGVPPAEVTLHGPHQVRPHP